MKIILIILVMTLICFGNVTAFAGMDWNVEQVTFNSMNDENPFINNMNEIVWSGWDGNDFEIFHFDGSTVSQITTNNYDDRFPQLNDSGIMAWTGYDTNGSNVFRYDGATTRLTNNINQGSHTSTWTQINNSGDMIWHDWDGTDYELFRYDGTSAAVTQVTSNSVNDLHPDINSTGSIAWHQWDGNDYEIIRYDGTSMTQITDNTWDDIGLRSQLNDSGQITWYGFKDGSNFYGPTDAEIYYFDGTNVVLLTDNGIQDFNPAINNNGFISWGSGGKIKVYDGSDIHELGLSGFSASEAIINDSANLVWYGSDAFDREIIKATTTPEPATIALFGIGLLGAGAVRRKKK